MSKKYLDLTGLSAYDQKIKEYISENSAPVDATLTQAGKAADAKKTGDELTDLKSAIANIDSGTPITKTVSMSSGRYLYSSNTVGSTPSRGSGGKYCIIDVGKARGGGTVKISIATLEANQSVATLITDSENKITRRWVTSGQFTLNAETNLYECTFTLRSTEYQIYFSIYDGSSSCTAVITPSYSLASINEQTNTNTANITTVTNDLTDVENYIKGVTATSTVSLSSGRYIYSNNPVGNTPSRGSDGKYCIIDTGIALNGGKVKISIDSITSNQTVATLLTDENDIITNRWVTYNSAAADPLFEYNAETGKFENTFKITNQHKIYFSIYGGSSTCTVDITPPEIGVQPETYYVSANGDDTNTGLSSSNPLATIAKAISLHAKNIYLLTDLYEKVTISTNVNIFGNGHTIYGDVVLTTEAYNNILKAAYSADTRITNCYVNHTTDLTETVSGSTWKGDKYNICCFADDNRLLPVADIATCEATDNSFTWDDGYFYINATGTRYSYVVNSNVFSITKGKVTLHDVIAKHTYSNIISGASCSLELNGCKVIGSVNANCVTVEDGQLIARKTEVSQCWNDGLNTHGRGDSTIIDCYCHDCSDDGISQHDNTTGVIIGGEFCRCGKGGISSPINAAIIDIYNAYVHDNTGSVSYGIYAAASGSTKRSFRIFGCVIANNRIGVKNAGHDAYLYGNKFSGNTTNESTDSGGTTTYLD